MFCEKCGTKNTNGAKFCKKCGNSLNGKSQKDHKLKNKVSELSKRNKIIMVSVVVIVVVAIIVLSVLLNNPIKKLEDNLDKYYSSYTDSANNSYLVEIGKILKSNKNDQEVLDDIEKTTNKIVEKWVKNFNTTYDNYDKLKDNYDKVLGSIKTLYNYFGGLEYIMDRDTYNDLITEVNTLYYSKSNYLEALEYQNKNDEYDAYYYYQKVDESDVYYKKAQEYISNYVKEEIEDLKAELESVSKVKSDASNTEKLEAYLKELEYIVDNKVVNNIDLGSTDEYKTLYIEISKKVVEYTEKVVEELEKDEDYQKIIKVIDSSLGEINDEDSDEYNSLSELRKKYEAKIPDSLLEKYIVSSSLWSGSSKYGIEINDEEYESYVSFGFNGDTQYRTYRLNKEYQKFKTTIVRGEDWDKNLSGYFVIYGDDKELYKSDSITKNGKFTEKIDLDVSGVDDLRIEFVTKSESTSWNFNIYLVEPYLYK